MLYALEHEREIDTFVVYTDSETWAGSVHPVQALRAYRERTGIAARLVVVGMVANGVHDRRPRGPGDARHRRVRHRDAGGGHRLRGGRAVTRLRA